MSLLFKQISCDMVSFSSGCFGEVNCTAEWIAANHVLACRTALKQQGILGLNMAPCMRAFLEGGYRVLQERACI